MTLRLLQHQVHVLERLSHTTFRREVAIDHLATLHVHDLRIGGGLLRHREKGCRVESKAGGEYQPLGKRHAVEAEDEIDCELGAPAVADVQQQAAIPTVQGLLNGRAAGVNVIMATGQVGAGSQIRVRGVGSFSRGTGPDGKEMIAVNVRCLDDVDVAALKTTPFDGRSL